MLPTALPPLANHLWQSTIFAGVAWLVVIALRKHGAHLRHWVWLAASLKFLLPFSALLWLGAHLAIRTAAPVPPASISAALETFSVPFEAAPSTLAMMPSAPAAGAGFNWALCALIVWLCGLFAVAFAWWRNWRKLSAVLQRATPAAAPVPFPAVVSTAVFEPGVFGIWRPVLLLPAGIERHMEPAQFKAMLAHEAAHVRRHDNFTSALHMLIEAIFWFHPLVWWMGARLTEERERACDEAVLRAGSEPRDYAAGILRTCELYLQSPLACVAGVGGANLRSRIERILNPAPVRRLRRAGLALLLSAAAGALIVPVLLGMVRPTTAQAMAIAPDQAPQPAAPQDFEVVSIKPSDPNRAVGRNRSAGSDPGYFRREHVTLVDLVLEAYKIPSYEEAHPQLIALDWMKNAEFDIAATIPAGATREQVRIMEQRMLATRFGLVVHHETKPAMLPSIALAKGGLRLGTGFMIAAAATPGTSPPARRQPPTISADGFYVIPVGMTGLLTRRDAATDTAYISGQGIGIADLIFIESRELKLPVVDATGIDASEKFDLRVALPLPDGPPDVAARETWNDLLRRLGLELRRSQGTLDVLVVDHCERAPISDTPSSSSAVPSPRFEVTSVKPCSGQQASAGTRTAEPPSPDTLMLQCYPLRTLIARAYVRAANGKVQGSPPRIPVQGGPAWLDSDRYQISAKAEGAPGFAMMNGPMLQALLEDRFQLELHRETHEVPVYKLMTRNGASRLQPSQAGSCVPLDYSLPMPWPQFCGMPKPNGGANDSFELIGATLPDLCHFLSDMDDSVLDREVIDGTGIAGRFDIHFPGRAAFLAAAADTPNDPSGALFGVIQSTLAKVGLKLVAAKGPGEVIVIDHVARPEAN